jgi:peptidoglycan/LPS O-acetylase OafA/YrhL
MNKTRFEALDGWRGVAALSVALFHLSAAWHLYSLPWIRHAGMFVDLFFVLSGFVISHSYLEKLTHPGAVPDFLIRRFGRVWPLHIFTLGILVLLEVTKLLLIKDAHLSAGEGAFTNETSLYALLSNIVLLHSLDLHHTYTWNGPSWSICVEFWAYVIFAGVVRYARRHLVTIALAIALLSGAFLYLNDVGTGAWYKWGLFRCLLCFFTGVLMYRIYSSTPGFLAGAAWEWVGLGATIALTMVSDLNESIIALKVLVFGLLVLIFAHESGPFSALLRSAPLQRLGTYSYSIYLIHFPILTCLNSAIRVIQQITGVRLRESLRLPSGPVDMINIGHSAFLNDVLALAYVTVVCLVSALTYRYVEDPARRYFNGIARRRAVGLVSAHAT